MRQLKIGILNFAPSVKKDVGGSTNQIYKKARSSSSSLATALKDLGHAVSIYHTAHCQLFFDNREPMILYKNKRIKPFDVLIPRLNAFSNIELEISTIRQFELMGMPSINRHLPILRAMNKLRTLQILTKAKIPVPKTISVRRFEYVDEAIKQVGGYPVIIKPIFGTQGNGVAIIESRRSLYSALDIVWKYADNTIFLIQEYIAESAGSDYRAFVIGDKVVASMKRTAPTGDFRSNLHLGGSAVPEKLTEQEIKIAVRATKALGLDVAGVDLLRTLKGPVVMEMNACPGLAGITHVTGVDVAKEFAKYVIKLASKKK